MSSLTRFLTVALVLGLLLPAFAQTTATRPADTQRRRWQPRPPVTLYVAPTGDNTAAGTEAAPFLTIQHAIDQAGALDTVLISAGTYPERLVFHHGGRMFRGNLIVAAAPGATVTIAGGEAPGNFAVIDTAGQDYITLRGLTVDGGYRAAGIAVTGSWQVIVEKCHTINTNDSGIKVDKSGHVQVIHCDVEKACQQTNATGARIGGGGEESVSIKRSQWVEVLDSEIHHTGHEGIDVKEGSNNVLVRGNRVHNVERQALYTDAWDQPTAHIRFENNIAYDCGFGLVAGSETGGVLEDIWFVNNVVYNCRGPGIVCADWGSRNAKHPVRDIHFTNNTIVGNKDGGRNGGWGGGYNFENADLHGLVIRNNIFSDNGAAGEIRIVGGKMATGVAFDHNLLDGTVADAFKAGNILAKPEFVDAAKGDFRLKPGSPAIGAGSPELAPATDVTGGPRNMQKPTIGAYAAPAAD